MERINVFLACLLYSIFVLDAGSCSGAGNRHTASPGVVFVGCTPGDSLIRLILAIPREVKVDFIRWNLVLHGPGTDEQAFALDIVFGESQPNTLGFIEGGEQRSYTGQFTVSREKQQNITGEIYHLKSNRLPLELTMVKLNDNIFHLLTPQGRLMIGNGGWSYNLNRKVPVANTAMLPALKKASALLNDTSRQVTFDGRTPCRDFAADHYLSASQACFKLKWRLVLNRDPGTREPTTYIIRKVVNNQPRDITGKWTITRGARENPEVVIYQLDPESPETSISLLAGDENVIFFLDKKNELYTGNGDFSFTLNKKQ